VLASSPFSLAFAAATTASGGAIRARRATTEYSGDIGAPPEAVFPLLCPVREYEWPCLSSRKADGPPLGITQQMKCQEYA
jgi:hypothetical protein